MKVKLTLTKDEIEKIIAEKLHVPVENVLVTTEKTYEGYGPMEHEVETPVARVDMDDAELTFDTEDDHEET